ncbi:unnamed protein product [Cyclocybe aegerita]|uniref:Fungal-type protein kinase domain-containing protein n=1 Tax=Cyclocybe aegerita TaxID=1973307 RepID=A0A8S0VZS1_CYCAE|nr:unnamed protein product [Cyclocybe aegerita]
MFSTYQSVCFKICWTVKFVRIRICTTTSFKHQSPGNAQRRTPLLPPPIPRKHHRSHGEIVGTGLNDFKKPKELLQAATDAFDAHRQCLDKCGVLHQDVGPKNITLDSRDGGVPNDWDMTENEGRISRCPPEMHRRDFFFRVGTWYFMAADLLDDPFKSHTLQDDIESFFWVVFYYSLHFLPNTLPELRIKTIISHAFQPSGYNHEFHLFYEELEYYHNKPFSQWVDDALEYLDEYYQWKYGISDSAKQRRPNHSSFQLLFESALAKPNWPVIRTGVLPATPSPKRARNVAKRDDLPETSTKRKKMSTI